jgi:predicted phage terminase large subunit-like protein
MQPYIPTPEEIEHEWARRRFRNFIRVLKSDYTEARPHRVMIDALQRVADGKLKRLMISMPPRHGKSVTVSQLFPCFMLGRHPEMQIVQAGYGQDIALEHSRKARDLFVSDEMHKVFPHVFHEPGTAGQRNVPVEKQAAQRWGTVQKGQYYAVGIGGALTGRGADLAIIDDPVKNREDAESLVYQERTWDWYRSTLYTRQSPGAAIIVILTRWHPKDLAGQILKQEEEAEHPEGWEVINMPAIDDSGKALWPQRWGLAELQRIRESVGVREWNCLYQGRPVIRGGNLFSLDGLQWHSSLSEFPDDCLWVRFWDLASTEKERAKDDPDYTVGALVGVRKRDGMCEAWVKNIAAFQAEATERDRRIHSIAEFDGSEVRQAVEAVAGYKDAYNYIRRLLQGTSSVYKVTVSQDKVARAACLEPLFDFSRIHAIRGPWNDIFETQLSEFPNGNHDDVVDAVAGAYQAGMKLLQRSSLSVQNKFNRRTIGI